MNKYILGIVVVLIVIALGVLFWNRALPAVVAGLMLMSIVALNRNEFSVVFRDLSITCMAFALAFLVQIRN